MSEMLSAASIFSAVDLESVEVEVPEWGGKLRLKQMTAEQSLDMSEELDKPENKGLGMFILLIRSAVNDNNEPLFTMNDVPALKQKSIKVLNRLQREALRLNKMLVEDGQALKKA